MANKIFLVLLCAASPALAGTYTTDLQLYKPATGDTNYVAPFATGMNTLDAAVLDKRSAGTHQNINSTMTVKSSFTVTNIFTVGTSTLTVQNRKVLIGGQTEYSARLDVAGNISNTGIITSSGTGNSLFGGNGSFAGSIVSSDTARRNYFAGAIDGAASLTASTLTITGRAWNKSYVEIVSPFPPGSVGSVPLVVGGVGSLPLQNSIVLVSSHSVHTGNGAGINFLNFGGYGLAKMGAVAYDASNTRGDLVFETAEYGSGTGNYYTEKMRINTYGYVGIGDTAPQAKLVVNGNIVSSGTLQTNQGVKFPATQVPSTDVNMLDDYEEGTWTPVYNAIVCDGTSTITGTYTKIGRMVNLYIKHEIAGGVCAWIAGTSYYTGMPFAAPADNRRFPVFACDSSFTDLGIGQSVSGGIFPPTLAIVSSPVALYTSYETP